MAEWAYDPRLKIALVAHEMAIQYAVRVQAASSSSQGIARSALSILAHDAVRLHRAVEVLACKGWACAGPILTRSILDLALSALVIVKADRPDVAAFECLYAFTQNEEYQSNLKTKEETEISVREAFTQMIQADREAASKFLASSKPRKYWYSGRFKGQGEIIKAYGAAELHKLWRTLSGTTHGGYISIRMFRADPFRLDINPRRDPQTAARAVVLSTALLIALLDTWDRFVGGQGTEYQTIKHLLALAAPPES
jgi:hypothetical protein